jgi:hypothetical protein
MVVVRFNLIERASEPEVKKIADVRFRPCGLTRDKPPGVCDARSWKSLG